MENIVHSSRISGKIAATEEAAFVIYINVNIHDFRRMSTRHRVEEKKETHSHTTETLAVF